jgi:hypothetical protein
MLHRREIYLQLSRESVPKVPRRIPGAKVRGAEAEGIAVFGAESARLIHLRGRPGERRDEAPARRTAASARADVGRVVVDGHGRGGRRAGGGVEIH